MHNSFNSKDVAGYGEQDDVATDDSHASLLANLWP